MGIGGILYIIVNLYNDVITDFNFIENLQKRETVLLDRVGSVDFGRMGTITSERMTYIRNT